MLPVSNEGAALPERKLFDCARLRPLCAGNGTGLFAATAAVTARVVASHDPFAYSFYFFGSGSLNRNVARMVAIATVGITLFISRVAVFLVGMRCFLMRPTKSIPRLPDVDGFFISLNKHHYVKVGGGRLQIRRHFFVAQIGNLAPHHLSRTIGIPVDIVIQP